MIAAIVTAGVVGSIETKTGPNFSYVTPSMARELEEMEANGGYLYGPSNIEKDPSIEDKVWYEGSVVNGVVAVTATHSYWGPRSDRLGKQERQYLLPDVGPNVSMQRCIAAVRAYENEDYKMVVEDADWYQKLATDTEEDTTPPSRIAAIYHAGLRVAHNTADLMETAAQWTASVWDGATVNAVTKTKAEMDPSVFRPIPAEQVTRRHVKLDQVVNERLQERKLTLDPRCNLKYGRIVNAALHEFDADGDKKPLWDRLHLDDSECGVGYGKQS